MQEKCRRAWCLQNISLWLFRSASSMTTQDGVVRSTTISACCRPRIYYIFMPSSHHTKTRWTASALEHTPRYAGYTMENILPTNLVAHHHDLVERKSEATIRSSSVHHRRLRLPCLAVGSWKLDGVVGSDDCPAVTLSYPGCGDSSAARSSPLVTMRQRCSHLSRCTCCTDHDR